MRNLWLLLGLVTGEETFTEEDVMAALGMPYMGPDYSHLQKQPSKIPSKVANKLAFLETFENGLGQWIATEHERYEGEFVLGSRPRDALLNDTALVMGSPAAFYGLSSSLGAAAMTPETQHFRLAYEVSFSEDVNCGGAYVKLYDSRVQPPAELHGESPYGVMFGPDRCGGPAKLHVILRDGDREFHPSAFVAAAWGEDSHLFELELDLASDVVEVFVDGQSTSRLTLADFETTADQEVVTAKQAGLSLRGVTAGMDTVGFELWTVETGVMFDNIAAIRAVEESTWAEAKAALAEFHQLTWHLRSETEAEIGAFIAQEQLKRQAAFETERGFVEDVVDRFPVAAGVSLALLIAAASFVCLKLFRRLIEAGHADKGQPALNDESSRLGSAERIGSCEVVDAANEGEESALKSDAASDAAPDLSGEPKEMPAAEPEKLQAKKRR